jgi:hypothetical protein
LTRELADTNDSIALISSCVKNEVSGSSWANRLRMIDLPEGTLFPKENPVYELLMRQKETQMTTSES